MTIQVPSLVPSLVASADALANVAIAGRDFSLPAGLGTGTAAAINAMILAMGARHGGEIILPATTEFKLDAPIDNCVPSVRVRGPKGIQPAIHGASGVDYGLTIVPSFAGTVLRHRTRFASETTQSPGPRNTGGGFSNMRVIGNGIATRLLEVNSVSDGTYDLYLQDAVGTEAALFTAGSSGIDLAEACDVQRSNIRLLVRQLEAGAAQNANCVRFDGSATANTSLNENVFLDLQHYNGHGLVHANSDNNRVWMRSFVPGGGTGRCYINKGGATAAVTGRANYWLFLSANTQGYTEGTGDAAVASSGNRILVSDVDNGTPPPLLGLGAGCTEEGVVRAYTPTITANSGSLTSVTVNPHRVSVSSDKLCTVRGQIQIVNKGTGAVLLFISLPAWAPMRVGVADGQLNGICKTNGYGIQGSVSTNGACIRFYNASDTCVDGNVYSYAFTYEVY